jgi:hypothetical protein
MTTKIDRAAQRTTRAFEKLAGKDFHPLMRFELQAIAPKQAKRIVEKEIGRKLTEGELTASARPHEAVQLVAAGRARPVP